MLTALFDKIRQRLRGERIGKLESIDLTWGGAGNQVMKIDGIQYATWIDYKKWPVVGSVVTHKPYRRGDGRGNMMLCTRILDLNSKKP